jgi:optic atrophy protein 1
MNKPSATSTTTRNDNNTHDSLSDDTRKNSELLELQKKYKSLQGKLNSVEKENYELRKELSKHTGISPNAVQPGQKTLIEMYAEILNLLTEFDAKSPLTDRKLVHTLPQVVVVGDQSAGKTSVLEMVANARIFPRGGGEMMTRSPVMVTLSEGTDHVAMFNDSTRVYDLKKDEELKELRKEIERRMKGNLTKGNTISPTPVSLVVKGPQLKRMVLVDLPGIINTVTTGMAADTREQILKMCRQYMQNPNAIIMCVQDGSVDAERSIVTDLVTQTDPNGNRTIFVLTKVDMAENSGFNQNRMVSILDGKLFPMKALGYFAVITGRGNSSDSIEQIQRYEREYFAKSKLFQNGMLREDQLGTRNMISSVTDEFWSIVKDSVNEQALLFKTLRYNLEAEWRNRFPGERTLDRNDLFELGKADILTQVASLQVLPPLEWEEILMETLWDQTSPKVLNDIFVRATQSRSSDEFNTIVDIELHKWAESLQLASLCANVGMMTMFEQLHNKLASLKGGKFNVLSQGLREEVESLSKAGHKWESYNVDQLKYVQMSALDDKHVRTVEQWHSSVQFMKNILRKQVKQAQDKLNELKGPTSFSDRWLGWRSQSQQQINRQAITDELNKFIAAEPNHPDKLFPDELMTVQRSLKNQGINVDENEINLTWSHVYQLHFLQQAEQKAQKCQRGFVLRDHSPEYSCPEVTFFWRVQQVMTSSAHTLRVQILDREVRQLEQQVKIILDSISSDEERKRHLIRGDAVDKAEQLSKFWL